MERQGRYEIEDQQLAEWAADLFALSYLLTTLYACFLWYVKRDCGFQLVSVFVEIVKMRQCDFLFFFFIVKQPQSQLVRIVN